MIDTMQEVMVLPRDCFLGVDGFVRWPRASQLINSASERLRWMLRPEAESSNNWIQPIPCAIIRDMAGQYCIFRQAKQQRHDLNYRVSFIVGGHVDKCFEEKPLPEIFQETVKREVSEEIGYTVKSLSKPIGIVIDSSSVIASKHIGIVYEVSVRDEIKNPIAEEFSLYSIYNGQFLSVESLSMLRSEFDPWTFILFSQYLNGGFSKDIGRQPMLFTTTE